MDDKAYLCPATSTGMRGARNQKIFQPTDETRARKLPKYDFPISMVNITPGTYRIMSKKIQEIDRQQEIEITDDATYVFVRPKYFLGSSGSVWASEFMRLRYDKVRHKFEDTMETSSITDKASTGIYIMLTDALKYYLDSSE